MDPGQVWSLLLGAILGFVGALALNRIQRRDEIADRTRAEQRANLERDLADIQAQEDRIRGDLVTALDHTEITAHLLIELITRRAISDEAGAERIKRILEARTYSRNSTKYLGPDEDRFRKGLEELAVLDSREIDRSAAVLHSMVNHRIESQRARVNMGEPPELPAYMSTAAPETR
jgi:intergrase/recombinase